MRAKSIFAFLPLSSYLREKKKRIKKGKGEKETRENQPSEQMRVFDFKYWQSHKNKNLIERLYFQIIFTVLNYVRHISTTTTAK